MSITRHISGVLAVCTLYLLTFVLTLWADPIIVSGGPDNDYESWISKLNDGRLMVIFDRNPDWASGDLYVTFSTDDGASWSEAQAIIADDGDQATLSFVQSQHDTIRLWYASNEDGVYQIYAARSADGINWTRDGAVDLGWNAGTMHYDPTVILEVDGTFTMSYVVSGSGVYIAHSFDGFTWDTDKTQLSPSGYRARVMRHSNGTYVYAYHRRTGGTYEYDVFVRTSPNRVDWSDEVRLTTNMNSHDPFPNQMSDGAYMVYYAKYGGAAYNLCRRRSYNADHWEPEEEITFDAVNNTQPHFFVESDDIYLVWAHAVDFPDDHDVYFEQAKDNYSILSLSPSQNELNVASSADISVTFDKDLDTTTIIESTFFVNSRLTGRLAGSASYDVPTRTATFDVQNDYLPGDLVAVYLSNNILTDYGSPIGRDFVWTFTSQVLGGYGCFDVDSIYDAVDWLLSVCAADLDGDGFCDLIAGGAYQLAVLTNSGDGSFTGPVLHPIGWLIHDITTGDLDGDGDLDVVAACEGGEFEVYAAIFLNEGGGNLASPVVYMAPAPAMGYPNSVLVADLVGDGDLDVALTAGWSGSISVLYNSGDGTFAFEDGFGFYAGDDAKSLCYGDFDGDGDIDLACTNDMFGSIAVAMNNGDGTFVPRYVYPPDGQPLALAAADLDGDGDVDLAAAYASLDVDHVSVMSNDGTGGFAYEADYAVTEDPIAITTGDFDGDGDIDLVTASGASDSISVLRNNGDATFATRWAFSAGSGMLSLASADLDDDGDLDLATADNDSGTITVLFNTSWTPRAWYVSITGSDETGDGSNGNPFSTIQHGIDTARPGDTVSVADGTYTGDGNRDMDFLGKDIIVMSEAGPDVTIIDCEGSEMEGHNAFTFQSGESRQAVLNGFTITGAYPPEPPWTGGAIRCLGSSATIVNCVISGNAGYGLYGTDGSSMQLENCAICGNGLDGIMIPDNYGPGSSLDASGCLVHGNGDCGLCVVIGENITVSNCTIVGNGYGILFNGEPPGKPGTRFGQVIVENTIVAYNMNSGIERIFWYPGLEFYCNDAYGNGNGDYVGIDAYPGDPDGNISQPPLFCDSTAADFRIHAGSPCAPGYNDCGLFIGAFEIGCSEDYCGDADASGAVDIDDAVYLVNYIFLSGPQPDPLDSGDPDCSGTVDIDDVVYLISYIFGGGPVPCEDC